MITLKDISTYDLRKIQEPLVQQQFDLLEIKDYQTLLEALYNGLIEEDITMVGFLSVARDIVKTSDDFVNEVNNLLKSLDETREKITQNTNSSNEAKKQFDVVYESIVNN